MLYESPMRLYMTPGNGCAVLIAVCLFTGCTGNQWALEQQRFATQQQALEQELQKVKQDLAQERQRRGQQQAAALQRKRVEQQLRAAMQQALAQHSQTHWSFPAGKTLLNFRADEVVCKQSPSIDRCLRAKGYSKITQREYAAIIKKAGTPIDIAAQNISTGDLYAGKAAAVPSAQSSSIEMTGLTSGQVCTGYAEITKLVPSGIGSLGQAELLCRDGNKIVAEFVYQSPRSGYGAGVDAAGNEYLFLFGDLDIDPEAWKKRFDALFEKQQQENEQKQRQQALADENIQGLTSSSGVGAKTKSATSGAAHI